MTTLNARANAAYNARIEDWNREHPDWEWMGFDHQRDAYETGWEDGYKAARQEAGQEGMGGEDDGALLGLVSHSELPQEGEQASGALLARLEAIQASRQTDAERFAVGLCIAALGEAVGPLLNVYRVMEVLKLHNIECTGPGEVTCRGCRDKSIDWLVSLAIRFQEWREPRELTPDELRSRRIEEQERAITEYLLNRSNREAE